MHILVAEDDPAVREAVERSLRFEGYEVDVARDGVEALAAIEGLRPDAIVLDVALRTV